MSGDEFPTLGTDDDSEDSREQALDPTDDEQDNKVNWKKRHADTLEAFRQEREKNIETATELAELRGRFDQFSSSQPESETTRDPIDEILEDEDRLDELRADPTGFLKLLQQDREQMSGGVMALFRKSQSDLAEMRAAMESLRPEKLAWESKIKALRKENPAFARIDDATAIAILESRHEEPAFNSVGNLSGGGGGSGGPRGESGKKLSKEAREAIYADCKVLNQGNPERAKKMALNIIAEQEKA